LSSYLNGLKKFFVFQRERSRGGVAGIVVAGVVGSGAGVKNIEDMAFLPLLVKRDSVRHEAAALLNSGVIARGGVATCEGRKRLGSGCKKRELLKVRVLAGLVRPVFW
jgi:hypothetical protein